MATNLEHENIVESDSDSSHSNSSEESGSESDPNSDLTESVLPAAKRVKSIGVSVEELIESVLPAAKRVKSIGVTVEERILTIGAEMFENGKGDAAGKKEWKKLKLEEMQANLRRLEAETALTRFVVERLKDGGI